MTEYRKAGLRKCPRCGDEGEPETFFHSGDGLICADCHREEKAHDRDRHRVGEGRVDAMMNGLLSPAVGLGCASFVILAPEGPMPLKAIALFVFGVSLTIATLVRSFRFPKTIPRVKLWRGTALVGAFFGVVSLALFALRL